MLNYFYYYWGNERGLTGLEGWDIRAASASMDSSEKKEMADYCLKRCRGLTYGNSGIQEYVFFYRRFVVFRALKMSTVNQRDELACAISWYSDREDENRICFLADERKHVENVNGIVEVPEAAKYQSESLPEAEFWIHFIVCLRRMIINRSTCYLIVPQENYRDRQRAILSLIAGWLPEHMREEFSAVCTEQAENNINVRLCLCIQAPESAQGKDVVVAWKQSDVRSFQQKVSEPVYQMLEEIYQKLEHREVLEKEMQYFDRLSMSLDKAAVHYYSSHLCDELEDIEDMDTEVKENTDEKVERHTRSKLLAYIQRQIRRIVQIYHRLFRRNGS
ncbi:MAG: hypothetical protein IKV59_03055 [Lachnospiraceae bacterium]|nr:hypothetical protein [Lachnospiraceae bacterium]